MRGVRNEDLNESGRVVNCLMMLVLKTEQSWGKRVYLPVGKVLVLLNVVLCPPTWKRMRSQKHQLDPLLFL